MIGFMEFFRLFDCLSEVRLSEGGDQHVRKFDDSRDYTAKSAYKAYFDG